MRQCFLLLTALNFINFIKTLAPDVQKILIFTGCSKFSTSQKHFPDLGGDHYVISLLLSQTSSRWETNGRVPKCRPFSQVILSVECAVQQIRLSLLIVLLFTNKVSLSFQVFADWLFSPLPLDYGLYIIWATKMLVRYTYWSILLSV